MTDGTYELQTSEACKTIEVRATFTDDAGNEESVASAATAVMGGPRVVGGGRVLTSNEGTMAFRQASLRHLALVTAVLALALGLSLLSCKDFVREESSSGICDRSQQVRDAILAKLPDVIDCADVSDAVLSGLTGKIIILDNESITLQDGDFRGLSNLGGLYIHHNGLSALPGDAFDGLSNLKDSGPGQQRPERSSRGLVRRPLELGEPQSDLQCPGRRDRCGLRQPSWFERPEADRQQPGRVSLRRVPRTVRSGDSASVRGRA